MVHGGICLSSESNSDNDYYYENAENRHVEAKLAIANLAISLITDNNVIYLDSYSSKNGFTTTNFSTARLNELALERSENKYVLMDSSKFFASSIVSYSRHIKIITEAYPDHSYPETANIDIEIISYEK